MPLLSWYPDALGYGGGIWGIGGGGWTAAGAGLDGGITGAFVFVWVSAK